MATLEEEEALEIWKKPTEPSQIVMLDEWYKNGELWGSELLRGAGDTLYIVSDPRNPVLRYRDGKVQPLPLIPRARRTAFVSPDGTLCSGDGRTMFELAGGRWEPRFHLAWPGAMDLAKHGDKFIATEGRQLHVLEPTASIVLDPEAATVECKTPFIHWADVKPTTYQGHNFPDAAKRLSTFEHVDRIEFVEFEHDGRRLGLVAKDWETAKGALTHIALSGKDEDPRLICFAPEKPRVIKVAPARRTRDPRRRCSSRRR